MRSFVNSPIYAQSNDKGGKFWTRVESTNEWIAVLEALWKEGLGLYFEA